MASRELQETALNVRDSRSADMAAITDIYGEAVRNGSGTFELEPPSLEEMTERRSGILANGYPYLTAEYDGVIAGFAYANVYRTRPAYRFSVENSVYVSPQFQKLGIGSELLTQLIARCEKSGFRLMIAIIGDSKNQSSLRLHDAQGFQKAGVFPCVGWKFGRWIDTVHMTRALGAGPTTPPAHP